MNAVEMRMSSSVVIGELELDFSSDMILAAVTA